MSKNTSNRRKNINYWKEPEEGFPQTIYWKVIAGNRKLTILEESELVFDNYDLSRRQLPKYIPPTKES